MLKRLVKKLDKRHKDFLSKKAEKPQPKTLGFRNADVMDILSYAALKEVEDYITIDGRFRRTLYISAFPRFAENGWMDSLLHFSANMDLSIHIEQSDDLAALKKLEKKIVAFETTVRKKEKDNEIVYVSDTDPLDSAEKLHADIIRGVSRLYRVSVYVSIVADTLEELNDITEVLESELGKKTFMSRVARAQQIEAFQSVLPRGDNVLKQQSDLDTISAGLLMPFTSSEIVHPNGILMGINRENNSLVVIDRFSLPNYNSILFARSGSGKSYLSKVEIIRTLSQGTSVIIIDPEREYQKLSNAEKGTYIKLSPKSKQKINPFDLATTSASREDLNDHIQTLTELLSLMVGGLSDIEEALLDKAIIKIYANAKSGTPVLADLYGELEKSNETESMRARLDKYITGSLRGMFDCSTNIDLNNRLVVFDIKDVPSKKMRQLTMMVIANYVENVVKKRPMKRLLVIDEAWLLLEHEETARFLEGLNRRARKYWLGVATITQEADDFLKNKFGKNIAAQSALRILMRQDTTSIRNVTSEFNLSETESAKLAVADTGYALVIADKQHIFLQVTASNAEHSLITTDPRETLEK